MLGKQTVPFLLFVILISIVKIGFSESSPENSQQQEYSEQVICVHPDDEKLGHTVTMPGCRPAPGHSGIWNQEKTSIDVCAKCQKDHEALASLCKVTPVNCLKKRPVADN